MFKGSITAMATPFKIDGAVDFEALDRFVEFQIENGTDALLPCGSTGEAATMTHDEKITVISHVIKIANGRVPVIAGAGSNNTAAMVQMVREAQGAGADAALVVAPYYNKPLQEGLYQHFCAAAAVGLPVIIYNVPGRTGVNILPETILRLAKVPNIVAIKDATGTVDSMMTVLREAPDFTVLCGDDSLTLPMMCLGATGIISVASNVFPREVSNLTKLIMTGRYDEARTLHYRMLSAFKALFIETNPIPVKEALATIDMMGSTVRLPLTEMSAENRAILRRTIGELKMEENR